MREVKNMRIFIPPTHSSPTAKTHLSTNPYFFTPKPQNVNTYTPPPIY